MENHCDCVKLIGNFKPSQLDEEVIRQELAGFLESHGILSSTPPEVRPPAFNYTSAPHQPDSQLRNWHDDSGYEAGIYWSNIIPTEVRHKGRLYNFSDGDVIYVKVPAEHRFPIAGIDNPDRWFSRHFNFRFKEVGCGI